MRHFDAWLLRDPYSIFHYYPTGRRWQETVRDLIHDRKICSPIESPSNPPVDLNAHPIHPQSDSLFMTRLPPEIRLRIYQYAFGDEVVHLVQLKDKIRHVRCPHADSSLDRNRRCCPVTPARWRLDTSTSTNTTPTTSTTSSNATTATTAAGAAVVLYPHTHPALPSHLSTSSLPLLRTCRAIYAEAADLPYTTPTFDVDDLHTFIAFAQTIAPQHLRALKRLSVHYTPVWQPLSGQSHKSSIYAHTHNDELWTRFWDRVAACSGLEQLHLTLDLGRFTSTAPAGPGAPGLVGGVGGGGGGLRLAIEEPWVAPILAVRGLRRFELAVTARADPRAKARLERELVRDAVVLRDRLREVLCSPGDYELSDGEGESESSVPCAGGRRPRLAITAA
jgi:hypothetical protein